MTVRKNNPSEPTGAATEKVVTYWRKPAHYKGREWLEKELGQMRLFEYNPAHLSIEKVGAKYGVLLNSQILKRFDKKAVATKFVNSLKERAKKMQTKTNPSNLHIIEIQPNVFGVFLGRNCLKKFRTRKGASDYLQSITARRINPENYELGDLAATGAREALAGFDFDDDGALDFKDVEAFDDYGEHSTIVVDVEGETTGEILTETPDGDVVVEWATGETTIEDKDELVYENGFKSWRLRRKAARQYKKGLRHEERARKARGKQSEIESELRRNPTNQYNVYLYTNYYGDKKIAIAHINAMPTRYDEILFTGTIEQANRYLAQARGQKRNPGIIGTLADLAVGTLSAMEIKDKLKGQKRKPANKSVTKRNPSFSQLVQTAGKQGKNKVFFPVANIVKVREYAKANGGKIQKHGIRFFYHLPKSKVAKVNPAATKPVTNPGKKSVTTRGKKNPVVTYKKNETGVKPNWAFEAFQGRPVTRELSLIKPHNAPDNQWTLGKLLEIKVKGTALPFNFRREETNRTFYLCADNRSKKLWILGAKFAGRGDAEFLGEIVYIVYETQKLHLGDEHGKSAYIHFLGEEGGKRPDLELDTDGFAHIIGGDYTITPLGIKD